MNHKVSFFHNMLLPFQRCLCRNKAINSSWLEPGYVLSERDAYFTASPIKASDSGYEEDPIQLTSQENDHKPTPLDHSYPLLFALF
jgi:hypothetical protein